MIEYTKDELKKLFYKKNTVALFKQLKKGNMYYFCSIPNEGNSSEDDEYQEVMFIIPIEEIGDATFTFDMPAKHLIRWMV